MNILPVILAYISFALGGAPYWLYIPMVVIWGIGGDIVIVRYAQKQCGLPVMQFVKGVLNPVLGVSVVMLLMGILMTCLFEESFFRLLLSCVMTSVGLLISLLSFGMSKDERSRAIELVKR